MMRIATVQLCRSLLMLIGAGMPLAQGWANPYDCLIEPNQTVELRSPVEGVIQSVLVRRGDRVRAGQVLVNLESAVEQSSVDLARYRSQVVGRLDSARNRLDYASKKYQRLAELNRKNFVSEQVSDEAAAEQRLSESAYQEAKEELEVARLEYRLAMQVLSRRALRSPFDGVVVDRFLNPGDLAESGAGRKPILKLAQVKPLRVEVVLPIEAYGKVKRLSKAQITPEALGGRYAATVTIVDSVFDSASGTFGVRLELPNTGASLPAGVHCKADFPALRNLTSLADKPQNPAR
ncbi:MAG: efflux RND transporter periplasmic adaptor subunit [Hylemonella sp.]|nr:efflux RND transporter periplasmic adaptor subunit [Hylemonella sp.]